MINFSKVKEEVGERPTNSEIETSNVIEEEAVITIEAVVITIEGAMITLEVVGTLIETDLTTDEIGTISGDNDRQWKNSQRFKF